VTLLAGAIVCPACGGRNVRSEQLAGPPQPGPKPGDMGLCGYCATMLVYLHNGAARLATDEDLAKLPSDRAVIAREYAARLRRGVN
jgi:hypothetical protein